MKPIYQKFLASSLLVTFLLSGCNSEEQFSEDKFQPTYKTPTTQFDKYLQKNYVDTYNIEFLYKWKDIEASQNHTITPADYANSVKMANLVKYLCLDAYEKVAPNNFLKRYFPKMITLVGSFAFNTNRTILLGTAEGGLKITLYGVNTLDPTNVENLYNYYFRTIFHEFSHILHQTTDFSVEFKKLTAADYIGDSWSENNNTEENALKKGFISRYSRKDPNEDFVELIAYYITYTDEQWTNKMSTAGNTGAELINRKITIVKSYLKNSWQIDLDELKNEVQTRANNIKNIDLTNTNL